MRSGKLVAGRFMLREKVGSGPTGVTLQGVDQSSGQPVAVKYIERKRLVRAAPSSLAATLTTQSPTLVGALAHGDDEDGWYSVRRWVEGDGLDVRRLRGPLDWPEAEALWEALAVALAELHQRKRVHLGLSPANVLVERGQVRVVDAGHAQVECHGAPFRVRGTQDVELYLAPEQVRGQPTGPRSDVFALGAVMHAMLTGVPSFRGTFPLSALGRLLLIDPEPVTAMTTGVPGWAERLLVEMLDRDPARRPADGDEVRRRLASGAAGRSSEAPPRPPFGVREQRVVAVLMGGGTWVHPRPEASRQADQLVGVLRAGGVPVERLADGSVLATLPPGRPPVAAVKALGLAAAAVKAEQTSLPLSLATGRGEARGWLPDGDLLERAASMVQTEVRRGGGHNVRADGLTAALLEGTIPVGTDDGGHLVGVTAASMGPPPDLTAERPERDEPAEDADPLDGEGSAREVSLAHTQPRLDALPAGVRQVLRAASLFGERCWRAGVEHVLGQPVDWRPVESERLLIPHEPSRYPGQAELSFADAELRQLAEGSLLDEDARQGHRRAAAWLQDIGADDEAVAAQLSAGADGEGLCELAARCADEALAGGDPTGALDWLDRVEQVVTEPPGPLLARRTVALRQLGQRAQGRRAAQRALEMLTRGSAQAIAVNAELLDTCGLVGDTKRINVVLERMIGLADPGEAGVVALALGATAALRVGKLDLAARALGRATAVGASEDRTRGLLLSARALRAQLAGYPAACLNLRRAAAYTLREAGALDHACHADAELALTLLDIGANAQAELLALETLGEARTSGLLEVEALGKVALGLALHRRAQTELARATTREAIAFFGGRGSKLHEGRARLVLATILLGGADAAGAQRELDRALVALDPFVAFQPVALAMAAQARLSAGDVEAARDMCARAELLAPSLEPVVDVRALLRPVLAQIAQVRGEQGEARQLLIDAEQHLLARAADFDDAALSEAYLRHVPDHARTLQLARLLSVLPPHPPSASPDE